MHHSKYIIWENGYIVHSCKIACLESSHKPLLNCLPSHCCGPMV
uniref:Uncharacterized protein n=1 Tax=Arundo donax TaxID=35708 RepID=A0A0A9A0Q3_ARUDO